MENWTKKLVNLPAVYALVNLDTGRTYIGETDNYKNRLKRHVTDRRNGEHDNADLQEDWDKLSSKDGGIDKFVFVLHKVESANSPLGFDVRLKLQKALQDILISKGLCYNTGLSETIKPRATGLYPSEAGVLYIKCKVNGAVGFFYTGFRQGIAGKIRQIRGKLEKNEYGNEENALQKDWNTHGLANFEFGGYAWGSSYVTEESCQKLVNHLIYNAIKKGQKCYNTHYRAPNEVRLPLSTPALSLGIPNSPPPNPMVFIQRDHLTVEPPAGVEGKPIVFMNQKPIVVDGNVYLSIAEAAKCYNVNWNVVKEKVDKKRYSFATYEEIQAELVRRGWSTNSALAVYVVGTAPKTTKGITKYFKVHGRPFKGYEQVRLAGFGKRQTVDKRITAGDPNYVQITKEEYEFLLQEIEE